MKALFTLHILAKKFLKSGYAGSYTLYMSHLSGSLCWFSSPCAKDLSMDVFNLI